MKNTYLVATEDVPGTRLAMAILRMLLLRYPNLYTTNLSMLSRMKFNLNMQNVLAMFEYRTMLYKI